MIFENLLLGYEKSSDSLVSFLPAYSFFEEVHEDFILRKEGLERIIKMPVKSHVCIIDTDKNNRKFDVSSALSLGEKFDEPISKVIYFLDCAVNNPSAILKDLAIQDSFHKSVIFLRGEGLSIKKIYEIKNLMRKEFRYDNFLFSSESEGLYYVGFDESEVEEISIGNNITKSFFQNLIKRGILSMSGPKVEEMVTVLKSKNNLKSLDALRAEIKKGNRKTSNSFLSLSPNMGVKDMIEHTKLDDLVEFFPFNSSFNIDFIRETIKKIESKQ